MPLYEYRCNECRRKFSLLEGVTAKKAKRVCPKCGSRKLTKLISRIAPIVREEDCDDDLGDDLDDDYDGDYDDSGFGDYDGDYDDSEFGDDGGDWDDEF
jgi:putative FmdB family regulatory protein